MRRFFFRLDKVLEYRRHRERQVESEFSVVLADYSLTKNRIDLSLQKRDLLLSKSRSFLEQGFSPLFFYRDRSRSGLKERIYRDREELSQKEIFLKKAREKLLSARKDRRVLEILREKAKDRYRKEEQREEDNQMSDLALISYLKRARE